MILARGLNFAGALAIFAIAAIDTVAWAQQPSGLSIIEESDRRIKAKTEQVTYQIDMIDQGKVANQRKLVRNFKAGPAADVALLKFTEPAVVRNVGLLIEDTGKIVNDIWLYTPATRQLRRIAGEQKQNWFMGTEFTYEDFESYNIKRYDFKYALTEPCGAWPSCMVVDAVPKDPAEQQNSGYSRKRYWIEAGSYYPVQIELYDKMGALWKRQVVEALTTVNGYPRPLAYSMANLRNNRSTRLVTERSVIDQPLDDYQVSTRFLRAE